MPTVKDDSGKVTHFPYTSEGKEKAKDLKKKMKKKKGKKPLFGGGNPFGKKGMSSAKGQASALEMM